MQLVLTLYDPLAAFDIVDNRLLLKCFMHRDAFAGLFLTSFHS